MNALAILRRNIRYRRLAEGWSQEAVATKAGLAAKYYQDVEAGRRPDLKLTTIQRIARALNVQVWEIFKPGCFAKPDRLRGRTKSSRSH